VGDLKQNIMATILLKYDTRNPIAQKTIDYILSLGIFEKKETTKRKSALEESMEDIEKGRVYKAKDVEDLFKQLEM
jgi:predicted transcriptional regulator